MIVWTVNIDRRKSRNQGRAIPKRFSVSSPSLEEIVEACKKLNLNPIAHPEKKYPSSWWEKTGYVEIDRMRPKTKTLIKIAEKIREMREKK